MNLEKDIDYITPVYTISKIAKVLGVSVQTLRLYEKEHLIIPFKKASKHRLYSTADLVRIKFIRNAINNLNVGIGGLQIIFSLIQCWKIHKCSDKDMQQCAAYNSIQPCWSQEHKNKICNSDECRTCSVYKDFNSFNHIKNKTIEISRNK